MVTNRRLTTQTQLTDQSRRDLLESVSKGLMATALIGAVLLEHENANAFDLSNLPPGFQICQDQVLVNVYIMMLRGEYNNDAVIKGALIGNGRMGNIHTGFVNDNTPLTEPAYWFAVNYYNEKYQQYGNGGMIYLNHVPGFNEIKKNPPMYNWVLGIGNYFGSWLARNRTSTPIETETYLLKAIFTAASRSESEAEAYKALDLSGKENKLRELMSDFDRLGAQMNRSRDEAQQRRVADSKGRVDETKDLDKNIFILEKRLQREKLKYEKEYELTQQLKELKQRQQAVANSPVAELPNANSVAPSIEYTRLFIAEWSSFFFLKSKQNLKEKSALDEALVMNSQIEIPLRRYVPKIRGNYYV